MRSWLVFAHIVNQDEKDEFDKNFKKCKKNLDDNTSVYVLRIYNKKLANVYYITKEKQEIIFKSRQKDLSRRRWLTMLVNFIKNDSNNRDTEIKAISYYGHGGSVVIGPWSEPFLGISQFTDYIIKPFNPILITMDSCYMGCLTSMYEVAEYCKFAAASPSWHPDLSVSTLKIFGKLPLTDDDETWQNYTKYISCEFQSTGRKPKYSCLLPIDLRNLRNLVGQIKVLKFNKQTNLKLNDPQQHDLYLSITDKDLQNKFKDILINKRCIDRCSERINGISIREMDSDDPWHSYFVKTKWYRVFKKIKVIK